MPSGGVQVQAPRNGEERKACGEQRRNDIRQVSAIATGVFPFGHIGEARGTRA